MRFWKKLRKQNYFSKPSNSNQKLLSEQWKDPDFNKDELAFYYVRVLEMPTPHWTAYDAKFFDLKDIFEEVPMTTQEWAYTSPIWYSPPAQQQAELLSTKQDIK